MPFRIQVDLTGLSSTRRACLRVAVFLTALRALLRLGLKPRLSLAQRARAWLGGLRLAALFARMPAEDLYLWCLLRRRKGRRP